MSLNFIWRNNKRVLIWRFTLVLININYGQIGDQTGLFYTTNPVFYTSGNRFVRRIGTFGYMTFSLVPSDNRNVEACNHYFTLSLHLICGPITWTLFVANFCNQDNWYSVSILTLNFSREITMPMVPQFPYY
jgi:hypothetical protein